MYIYEAGALTCHYKNNQFYKATEWRNILSEFCKDNNIGYFNPAETYLNERNHTYTPRTCVDQNRHYLNKSDIMVVDLNYIMESPGTQWELCYASEIRRMPIIAFGEESWSPHIMNGISHLCKDIFEAREVLCDMFNQK